jgi:starch synthase
MRVAFITPEVYPFSKTGGLADVSAALSSALGLAGCELTLFTPLYRSAIDWFEHHPIEWTEHILPEKLWIGDEQHPVAFRTIEHNGIRIVFILNGYYYDRPHLYLNDKEEDYIDSISRYSFFCRSVLAYYLASGVAPDIFHLHDWQSALCAIYLRTLYNRQEFSQSKSLFTVHNLGYQGLYQPQELYAAGLEWDVYNIDKLEFFGKINLLKGGIVYANAVNTVSPSYAREIRTEQYGKGLHGVLQAHRAKLSGILNGIDTATWDPETDLHLPYNFSRRSISGKAKCKRALQIELGLPPRADSMLLGVISRFDTQKGIDLVLGAFPQVANFDIQLVVLGAGADQLEAGVVKLAAEYPQQVAVRLGYNEGLAHRIEAGADAFLMPSSYEPCGLNQMYSQRYGTLPIVRETGGLKDTVVNASPKHIADGSAVGFTFKQYDAAKLAEAIRRAVRLYHSDRKTWRALMANAMRRDFSWHASAQQYLRIYQQLSKPANHAAKEEAHG